MARAGRPSKISAELAAAIDSLRAQGVTIDGCVRALAERGTPLSRRTIGRYCARRGDDAPPARLERDAQSALDTDDLGTIVRTAATVRQALEQWGPAIGFDPSAQRAFASLARLNADLSARLIELRPKPEVESDRLSALGEPARAALLARARAHALTDFAGKYQRARQVLVAKGWL